MHNFNCDACEIIVESSTISGIQGGGKKVPSSIHLLTPNIYLLTPDPLTPLCRG